MSRRKKIIVIAAVIFSLLAIVTTRAVWQGRSALADGEVALSEGRVDDAIRSLGRSARWYVPLAPHVDRAYELLVETASNAEKAGEDRVALSAWRTVRSSVLATRSFYTPHEQRLDAANRRIAELMAALEGPAADPSTDQAGRAKWHLDLLEKPVGPSVAFSVLAILGFLAWLGGAFWFVWAGLDDTDKLDRQVALRSGLIVVVGLIVWLVGLYKA